MKITLHTNCIKIGPIEVKIYRPSAFWKHIQAFSSKWDESEYPMAFAASGKQKKASRSLLGSSENEIAKSRAQLLLLAQQVIKVVDNAFQTTKVRVTPEQALNVALNERLSQATNATRQIHYGNKLSDSKGCLLVDCPVPDSCFSVLDSTWLATRSMWVLKGIATQLFLYASVMTWEVQHENQL